MKALTGMFVALLLMLSSYSAASSNEAERVMQRSLASDDGFGSSVANIEMTLIDRKGRSSVRVLELRTLEATAMNEERSIVVFRAPLDVSGTALLSHARTTEDDLQWLYLPTLKRVKRIPGANKSGPFVGSEFAFEDLAAQTLDKYTYALVGEETIDGMLCDVIVRTPRYKRSGYSHQKVWVDRSEYQVRRIEFYNRAQQLHKTLNLSDYIQHQGYVWRPHRLDMQNHLNHKQTILKAAQYNFESNLAVSAFERDALLRLGR
ncbi:MAG: outer membrane lipoprotein-sorting protein [Pseudomonadota bacterium]